MADQEFSVFEQGLRRYFSDDALARIRSLRVGIAGAGGLGSNCAAALVRSGFDRLLLCDFDRVEPSNLNRQFYFADQVGRYKVDALAENLRRINPDLQLETCTDTITAANAADLFAGCDAVVEAFDRVEGKRMLIETFYPSKKLLVAVSGLAGWGDADRIRTRRIHPRFFLIGDEASEAGPERPPCAPRVAVAAGKEADVVLDWALRQQAVVRRCEFDYMI